MKIFSCFRVLFNFAFLFVLIFNPYTVYGKPGFLIGVAFLLYGFFLGVYKVTLKYFFLSFFVLLVVSFWGMTSSLINGIFQVGFFYATVSFVLFSFSATGLVLYFIKQGINLNDFFFYVLFAIVFNSFFIILEISFPGLRVFVENYLAPAGNIDWNEGVRYRGLAASGGSGLSITVTVGVIICFYLFYIKYIKFICFFIFNSLLIVSVIFIGRTGLIFIPIGVFFLFFLNSLLNGVSLKRDGVWLLYFFIALVLMVFLYGVLYDYLLNNFGAGFIDYSFGFLLDGKAGLEREGTTSMIIDFMTVLPLEFPYFFTGIGFYGAGEFYPWTDSGYARVALSSGFLFGALYYYNILYFYTKKIKGVSVLAGAILFVLILSEVKGSFLFSEFGSRVLILIVTFNRIYELYFKENKRV